ncbi:MAG: hypothetical protein ACR2RE_07405 [Geminicoccaceae bacterium]
MAEKFDFTPVPVASNERWPENTLRISGINDSGRDMEAILARDDQDKRGGLQLVGGPSTYSLAGLRSLSGVTLFSGLRYSALVNVTCANSPTLNASGSGSRPIILSEGADARANDMLKGMVVDFIFDTSVNSWILLNPALIHPGADFIQLTGDQPIFEGRSTRDTPFTSMVLIRAFGENSAGEDIEYVRLDMQAADTADGTEDGRFVIRQFRNGLQEAAFDLRDANRLSLFGETVDGADNSIAVPAGFSIIEDGTKRLFGELLRVTRVNSGTHNFLSESEFAVIEAVGSGGGGSGSAASYGNVPSQGSNGGKTDVNGTNIGVEAGGGRGSDSQRAGHSAASLIPGGTTGSSVFSSFVETGTGAPGGNGGYGGSDGNAGDRTTAFCKNLPASVSVVTGGGGAGGPDQNGQGTGSAGVNGYAVIWEYK